MADLDLGLSACTWERSHSRPTPDTHHPLVLSRNAKIILPIGYFMASFKHSGAGQHR